MPANVESPDVLKRFLNHLIEELDIVLGFRGDDSYVSQTQLAEGLEPAATTLTSLVDGLGLTNVELEKLIESTEEVATQVSTNTNAISDVNALLASSSLDSTYHDFNDAAYATLSGKSEFSTLGSNLSNAPYVPVGGETYYNYFDMLVTANNGVVQVLRAYSSSTLVPTTYFRIGDTFAAAVALGWT